MNPARFDSLARTLARSTNRRRVVQAAIGSAVGAVFASARLKVHGRVRPFAVTQVAADDVFIECDGLRVRPATDPDYCGDCDTRCVGAQKCLEGRCVNVAKTAPIDDGCNARRLRLWFSAFVPRTIPNLTHPSPLVDGSTMTKPIFSSASPAADEHCYVTSGRSFSSDPNATALLHSAIEIDLVSLEVVDQDHRTDPVTLIDCDSGAKVCHEAANSARLAFSAVRVSDDERRLSFRWTARPAAPCVDGDPTLDYAVQVVVERRPDHGDVRVIVRGEVECFPAFEVYAALDDGVPVTLRRKRTGPGSAIGDLFFDEPCTLERIESVLRCGCGECETARNCRIEAGIQVCDDIRLFHLLSASNDPADDTPAAFITADGILDVSIHGAPVYTSPSDGSPIRTVGLLAAEGDALRLSVTKTGGTATLGPLWLHRLSDGRSRLIDVEPAVSTAGDELELVYPVNLGQARQVAGVGICCPIPDTNQQICADAWNDQVHCGRCGKACTTDEYCVEGRCECLPPKIRCGKRCIDTDVC